MQQLFVHCLKIMNWRNFLFEDDPYRWSEISQWSPKTLKWFQSWYLLPFFTLVWGGRQTDVIFLRLHTGVGWPADAHTTIVQQIFISNIRTAWTIFYHTDDCLTRIRITNSYNFHFLAILCWHDLLNYLLNTL